MLYVVNVSLTTGVVPASFKTAVDKLLLKKPHLDPGYTIDQYPIFPYSLKF